MATRLTTSPTELPYVGMLNSKSPLVTPSATPAPKASGRLSMLAMMAAASAGRMSVGPAPAAIVMPDDGALRMPVSPASRPGDHPDQCGEPAHGDAEQAGPVRVVGHRAHGHAGVGAQQEPPQGDQHHRDDDGDQEVVPGEEHGEEQHVVGAERAW